MCDCARRKRYRWTCRWVPTRRFRKPPNKTRLFAAAFQKTSDEFRNRPALRRLVGEIDEGLLHVAPAPAFRRIVTLDDGMAGSMKMLGGVSVRRVIAAADMAAGSAQP